MISYSILGWSLAQSQASLLVYFLVVTAIILLDVFLTVPLPNVKGIAMLWFASDTASFLAVIFSAFLFVFVIRWIQFFLNALVLVSAAILTRLDTQIYGLKRWQSFLVLVIISEASLCFGSALYLFFQ